MLTTVQHGLLMNTSMSRLFVHGGIMKDLPLKLVSNGSILSTNISKDTLQYKNILSNISQSISHDKRNISEGIRAKVKAHRLLRNSTTPRPKTTKSTPTAIRRNGRNPQQQPRTSPKPINKTEEAILEKLYYKKSDKIVFPFNHTFALKPRQNPCANQNLSIVIVVNSKVSNFEKRRAIRETWGKMATGKPEKWPHGDQSLPPMTLLFFLGRNPDQGIMNKTREEYKVHEDIVLGDFKDDYKNMTLKSMLCLKYLKLHCLNVQYVLKCDDDMMLNLPYIAGYLKEHPFERTFMGPHNPGMYIKDNGSDNDNDMTTVPGPLL